LSRGRRQHGSETENEQNAESACEAYQGSAACSPPQE
jgi:hypothetical protein